ncbi:Putative metallo-phosphoesterase [Rubellimicrobium mesophilum DSM 19309]|uniref:Putative metallo-phosphoesterase n=1 Tax=Rubellimicrobium mesophilum DSM 19309 TaxID=442562 RepID=A0A017HUV8_9RHOB|nr:ligase-associated DNA damage response endonuclease PdeM [Rubellimicrobium mesophilum]EYD77943.1 Putative metallo-phosphoesterase [Rubellimicrobium mesophilum DSM 19309]
MNGDAFSFTLNGTHGLALPSGALFLPTEDLLCVSDLHLAKSERMARRRGVMLPPYETRAALDRLAQDIALTKPAAVVALGDSFDDIQASESLDREDRITLARLQEGRRWVWIEGNHDAGSHAHGGEGCDEFTAAGLTFRHIAEPDAAPGEVSGHYHPKYGPPGLGDRRPCFLLDARRLILPAYGTYTGGLDAREPVLRSLFADRALAVLTGGRAVPIPLPAARRRARNA